ncbi:MAG: orotidine-5'-phosphate decarboxylase [Spirochaetia bacterium]|nr:orotidine-5'-phosphate decarboxylase [Spirochaetia bacterium]
MSKETTKLPDLREKLILSVDLDDTAVAYDLIDKLAPHVKYYKIGLQLITKDGPRMVMTLKRKGLKIFYDAKFYDIPQTVYNAAYEATRLGVNMMNVHASGGPDMIARAKDGIEACAAKLQTEKPKLLAVTVLTSMESKDLKKVLDVDMSVKDMVLRLATMAKKAGADGVVCSPQEIKMIKKELGNDFLVVTPGIRMDKGKKHDQKRVMNPREAIEAGADYIVAGRPILEAPDKMAAIEAIMKQIKEGCGK